MCIRFNETDVTAWKHIQLRVKQKQIETEVCGRFNDSLNWLDST